MEPLVGDLPDDVRPHNPHKERRGRQKRRKGEGIGTRPTDRGMEMLVTAVQPLYWYMSPVSYGIENIPTNPSTPVLFVGNHSLYGLDISLFVSELWIKRKIIIRPLADHAHFRMPIWREIVKLSGIVEGNPENCDTLMERKENILVYPGGAREVFKLKGEKYKLIWGNRLGFAKMAIKHNYTIVPFACVGIEDMYDVLVDSEEILSSPVGKIAQYVSPTKEVPPIFGGLGGTLIPRPYRLYFWFGQPISTSKYSGQHMNDGFAKELKEHTKTQVEWGIDFLKKVQASDKYNLLSKRMEADVRERPWLRFLIRTGLEAWNGEGTGYDPRYAILSAKKEQQRMRIKKKTSQASVKNGDAREQPGECGNEEDESNSENEDGNEEDSEVGDDDVGNDAKEEADNTEKEARVSNEPESKHLQSSKVEPGEAENNASDAESEVEFEADLLQKRVSAQQFYNDLILEAVRSVGAPFITSRM